MDAPLHNQPELPSSTVVEPKRLPVGRTASSTRLAVAYLLSCFHLPGVGLDFLLQIHDRRSTILRWGACRDRQVHTPPALSPQECCEAIAGAPQEGGGVLFSHSWAGFSARGLPRRRGQRLWHFKTLRSSPSHRKQGSAGQGTNPADYRWGVVGADCRGVDTKHTARADAAPRIPGRGLNP